VLRQLPLSAHPRRSQGRAPAKDRSPPNLAVYGRDGERRVSSAVTAAGERAEILAPAGSRPRFSPGRDLVRLSSQLDLLRDAERVVYLYAKIADCAFELCVSEQQLNRPQIARLLVDLGRLRPSHRMRAIRGAVKPGALDPGVDNSCILSCREVRVRPEAAREEIRAVFRADLRKPGLDRGAGLLGDLELNRPACLLLNDSGAVSNSVAGADIVDLQAHKVAASEFAIDGKIEKSEVARSVL